MITFAFCDTVNGWDSNKDAISIDVTSTPFNSNIIAGFKQLKRFRASNTLLSVIKFENLPELECIDLSCCKNLNSIYFTNCPKIKAIEVSQNRKLCQIIGDLSSVEYFSAYSTGFKHVPSLPSVKFLNLIDTRLEFNCSFLSLEELHLTLKNETLKLSEITKMTNLIRLVLCGCKLISDQMNENSKLRFITIKSGSVSGALPDCIYASIAASEVGEFPATFAQTTWEESALLLYGPWGVPPIDRKRVLFKKSVVCPFASDESIASIAADSIAGAIFGSAIMDMVGLSTEFMTKPQARITARSDFSVTWSHNEVTKRTLKFLRGTPTDDTSQAVLIMRNIIRSQINPKKADDKKYFKFGEISIDLSEFCSQFKEWSKTGHKEHKHTSGLGMGRTVKQVLRSKDFETDPISAATRVWIDGKRNLAANGSVMRTSPTGCFCFWDESVVKETSKLYGKVTHVDPRCVYSTVLVSLICAWIIKHKCESNPEPTDQEIEDIIQKSIEDANDEVDLGEHKEAARRYLSAETIEDLQLSEKGKIGYTLKALGAAVWALRHCRALEDAMAAIAREGGDADTNGAVAGVLIGARIGLSRLPRSCLDVMHCGQWMFGTLEAFLGTMGLSAPKSPFL